MEIKASEVRRGNYLKFRYKEKPIKVTGISANQINASNVSYFSGIVLTNELLLRCGFDWDGDEFTFELNGVDYKLEKQEDWWFIGVKSLGSTLFFAWHIYYIHQLQNLYHSLTSQELTITL